MKKIIYILVIVCFSFCVKKKTIEPVAVVAQEIDSLEQQNVRSMNQITTNYDTLINNIRNKGDIDSYYELFAGCIDGNKIEQTDSVMKYSRVMAEKFNCKKAYLDYYYAFCLKNSIVFNPTCRPFVKKHLQIC